MLKRVGLYFLAFSLIGILFSVTTLRSGFPWSRPVRLHRNGASNAARSGVVSPREPSKETVFGLIFREIAHFNGKADDLAAHGKPYVFFRNFHQNVLALDQSVVSQVRQIALDCERDIKELDGRAGAIIQDTKQRYRGKRALVPPPPRKLFDLQAQRSKRILAAVDQIKSVLGPNDFASFEKLARSHVGSGFARNAVSR